ncbi:MAG: YdeI/OmpD-associated family protein [candidate division WOR-3 bacterium]|nr:MAG: YdeI/OmpD-associated family protein [candidate division WOR-3 bacterium]
MTRGKAEPLDFRSAAEWRRWLRRNHNRSEGEWVYMYKKGAKRAGLRYPEALDEALCFGWIDGQLTAVDEDRYRQRWTPRRKGSNWSEVNKRKVRRLIAGGRLAEPGLAEVRAAKRAGRWRTHPTLRKKGDIPAELLAALKADSKALANFRAFASSYRRTYAGWVAGAKTGTTRRRRIEAVVRRSRENRKPGIDSLYR